MDVSVWHHVRIRKYANRDKGMKITILQTRKIMDSREAADDQQGNWDILHKLIS